MTYLRSMMTGVTLVVLAFTSACGANSENRLVGVWESAPAKLGPNEAISTWTFGENDALKVELTYPSIDVDAPPQLGTYSIDGDKIKMIMAPVGSGNIGLAKFRFEGDDVLVIIEGDKEFKYLRKN